MLKSLAFAAAVLVADPAFAGTTVLEHSQAFEVRTGYALREGTLFSGQYGPAPTGDAVAAGYYAGTMTFSHNPLTVVLPAFDARLGTLTAAVVSIASERAVSVSNFTIPPNGASLYDQMQYTARAAFTAHFGSQLVTGGNASRGLSCVTATAPNQACIFAATDRANFADAVSFDPALFQSGPVAIDLNHTQAIDWDGYAFFGRGAIVGVGNTFEWTGSVGVRYEYTPFAAGVPEPEIWALLILGFGAVGGALRRRAPLPNPLAFT